MLTPERWQIVEGLFHEALTYPEPQRSAFVASSCADDPELRSELQSLLDADVQGDPHASVAASIAASWASGDAAPLVGREIDGFHVRSLIGAGGMGEVFLADEVELGRRVALKLLPVAFTADPGRLRRFADEARAASSLNHPSILTVYRVGEVDGRRYIATEFIDGQTLRDRMSAARLPANEALDIALQIASALGAAHEAGIIHRDIKPDNIMIRRDGYVKVLDFGLAKLTRPSSADLRRPGTREGAVVGTADYMAPEQAAGNEVDARTDLYSLGVVLHEMLTGLLPRESATGVRALSEEVGRVVGRGIASDPAMRYASAAELARDLEGLKRAIVTAPGRARPIRWSAAAAILVLAGAGALLMWRGTSPLRWFQAGAPTDGAATVPTLAVLPFQALQLSTDDQYLGLGIADAVITQLGNLHQMTVRPTTSVREFTQPDADLVAVGRKLGVDHVLGGLVQRDGEQMRVTVQLMEVRTGSQRWSARIDVPFRDLFSLQDAVSQRVAAELVEHLSDAERGGLAAGQTTNPEAYQLYLRGRYFLSRLGRDDLDRSLALFEQAVALDPAYARAYAGIAAVNRSLGLNFTQGAVPIDSMPRARQAALKALAINGDLAEALVVLGIVQFQYDYDWKSAQATLTRAITSSPNLAEAHRAYGWYLTAMGDRERSVMELQRAETLNPTEALGLENLGTALEFAGRSAEALQKIDTAIMLDPRSARPYGRRVWMLELHHRFKEAIATRQAAARTAGREEEALRIGALYARGGHRAILEDAALRPGPRDAIAAAWTYVQLADLDRAVTELERGATEKHTWTPLINADPRFAPLHNHPRFIALVRRVGLVRR